MIETLKNTLWVKVWEREEVPFLWDSTQDYKSKRLFD